MSTKQNNRIKIVCLLYIIIFAVVYFPCWPNIETALPPEEKRTLLSVVVLNYLWCIRANKGDEKPLPTITAADLAVYSPLTHTVSLLLHSTTRCLALPAVALVGPHTNSWPDCSPGWPTLASQHRATVWFHWRAFIYVSHCLWMWK